VPSFGVAALPEPVRQTLGPYQLVREIARGGMGVVYEAFCPRMQRRVALKVLVPTGATDDVERFVAEARSAGRLRHPHIVGVHEVGQDAGRYFIAMDLLEGETLHQRLRRDAPLPARKAALLLLPVVRAVAYAHEQGVLHRDLKPENVILTADDQPVLTDFGLAKDRSGARSLTQTGDVMGTPAYMGPEQASGARDAVDARSDVYSLGATLYHMLTGRPPFQGAPLQILARLAAETPPAPRELVASVDPELEAICLRCLDRDPSERYQSAAELAKRLTAFVEDGAAARGRSGTGAPTLAAAGIVAVGLLLAVVVLARSGAPSSQPQGGDPTASPTRVASTPQPGTSPNTPSTPSLAEQAEAQMQRGFASLEAGDTSGAYAAFSAAVELDRGHYFAWLNRGTTSLVLGDHTAARNDYTHAIELDPERADAYLARGKQSLLAGDAPGAVEDLTRALEIDPSAATAWHHRGIGLYRLGDLGAALADFDRSLELDPTTPDHWKERARARKAVGDLPGALEDHTRELELAPADAERVLSRALVFLDMQRPHEALEDCERALRLDPSSALALSQRGNVRRTLGDADGALDDCLRAYEANPRHHVIVNNLGSVRLMRGDVEGAAECYRAALALPGADRPPLLLNLLQVLRELGQLDEALVLADQVVREAPRHPLGHQLLAELLAGLGRMEDALQAVERGLGQAPGQPMLTLLRGRLRFMLGDREGAQADLQAVGGRLPDDPNAWVQLVLAWLDLEQPAQAEAACDRVLTRQPGEVPFLNLRARARSLLGDHAGAEADVRRSLELAPGQPEADTLRGWLVEIEAARGGE
jgi:serine/threonine protein kinase/tetratricopeptide (TPR) repeat protein